MNVCISQVKTCVKAFMPIIWTDVTFSTKWGNCHSYTIELLWQIVSKSSINVSLRFTEKTKSNKKIKRYSESHHCTFSLINANYFPQQIGTRCCSLELT